MPYIYLLLATLLMSVGSIGSKFYNKRNEKYQGTAPIFTLLRAGTTLLFWVIMFFAKGASLNVDVLPYALLMVGISVLSAYASVNSYKNGSVLYTSLIVQFSLIGVAIWGFFFWNSPFTWLMAVGLVLVAVSLWLCLYTGKQEDKKITPKWLFWVALFFLTNMGYTIVMRTQQMHFNGEYGPFMMLIVMSGAVLTHTIIFLKGERTDAKTVLQSSWWIPVALGVAAALVDLFVMLLVGTTLSASFIYPTLAIGALAVVTIFSKFVFKDEMRWWQWIGVAVGAVAVAIISI